MWLVQKIWFSERIDIENQAGSWPWRWNTSLTKRRKLFKPQVWNYGRIYSKLNQKETPKIPRGCGLFSLATWVPSVPSGSSRWPTTVGVLVRLRRCPVPPLDRALFSLATSTARRRSKLFSLAEHDRTLRYRCPRFRPIFSRLSASSSRLPGPPVWKWSHPTTKTTTTRTRASRSVFRVRPILSVVLVWFFGRFCSLGREEKSSISRGTLPGVLGGGIQAQGKRPPGSVNQLDQYWKQKQNP